MVRVYGCVYMGVCVCVWLLDSCACVLCVSADYMCVYVRALFVCECIMCVLKLSVCVCESERGRVCVRESV